MPQVRVLTVVVRASAPQPGPATADQAGLAQHDGVTHWDALTAAGAIDRVELNEGTAPKRYALADTGLGRVLTRLVVPLEENNHRG